MSSHRPSAVPSPAVAAFPAEASLRGALFGALFLGLVAIASLPAARAVGDFGWMPLWLVGMPLSSLLVLSLLRHRRPDSSPARTTAPLACASAARRWPSARPGTAGPRLVPAWPRRAARPRLAPQASRHARAQRP